MKYSIIVPVYCIEEYIGKCIDSLQNQYHKNIEIILVNDGSLDGSGAICDAYAIHDKRITVIHKENGGVVSARKAGVDLATGDYIVCIDGDDWVPPEYISSFEEIAEKYRPDIICCGYVEESNREIFYLPKVQEGLRHKKEIENEIYPFLIAGKNGECFTSNLWAKAIKTELYRKCEFVDEKVIMGEDDASIKACIYHADSIYVMDKCLYHYIRRESSITKGAKPFAWDGPMRRAHFLMNVIDLNTYDMKEQIYRMTVRAVFNVAASQFRRKLDYFTVKRDIILNLRSYKDIIDKCDYKGATNKDKIMLFVLKNKCILFLKLYCMKRL